MLELYFYEIEIPSMTSMGFNDEFLIEISVESGNKNSPVELDIDAIKGVLKNLTIKR